MRESAAQTFAALRHTPAEASLVTTGNRLGTDSGASDHGDENDSDSSYSAATNSNSGTNSDSFHFANNPNSSAVHGKHRQDSSSSASSGGAASGSSGGGGGAAGGAASLLSRSTVLRRERPSLRQHALQMHHRITAQFEIQDRDRQRRFAKVRRLVY